MQKVVDYYSMIYKICQSNSWINYYDQIIQFDHRIRTCKIEGHISRLKQT